MTTASSERNEKRTRHPAPSAAIISGRSLHTNDTAPGGVACNEVELDDSLVASGADEKSSEVPARRGAISSTCGSLESIMALCMAA
jgi:hypothetical protein